MASVNADYAWEIVVNRDRHCDGRFVYAVSSTECIAVLLSFPATGSPPRDVFRFAATGRVGGISRLSSLPASVASWLRDRTAG